MKPMSFVRKAIVLLGVVFSLAFFFAMIDHTAYEGAATSVPAHSIFAKSIARVETLARPFAPKFAEAMCYIDPEIGSCGRVGIDPPECDDSTYWSCYVGTVQTTGQNANYYTWYCRSGSSISCSYPKAAVPVIGVCGSATYECAAGTGVNNVDNGYYWTWTCNGLNGGANSPQCKTWKPIPAGAVSIYSDVSGVTSGGSTNIHIYTYYNASSCTITRNGATIGTGGSGTSPFMYTVNSGALTTGATFSGTCSSTAPPSTASAPTLSVAAGSASCGAGLFTCAAGAIGSQSENAAYFYWGCYAGSSASCSYPKATAGAYHNSCLGNSTVLPGSTGSNASIYWWQCTESPTPSSYTFQTEQCDYDYENCYYVDNTAYTANTSAVKYEYKPGVCNSALFSCLIGTAQAQGENATNFTWQCVNSTGPVANCTYPKAAVIQGSHYNCNNANATPLNPRVNGSYYNWGCQESPTPSSYTGNYSCGYNCDDEDGGYYYCCSGTTMYTYNATADTAGSELAMLPPVVNVSAPTAYGAGSGQAYDGENPNVTWTASNSPTSCNVYKNGGLYASGISGALTSYSTGGITSAMGATTFRVDCGNGAGWGTGNTVTFKAPPVPTGLSASCPAQGSTRNYYWSLPGGISSVYFRTNKSPTYDAVGPCAGPLSAPEGECIGVGGSSYSAAGTPGAVYQWWIHSMDVYGNWSAAASNGTLGCVVNGVCAVAAYNCSSPLASINTSYTSGDRTYHWTCPGANGGTSNTTCNQQVCDGVNGTACNSAPNGCGQTNSGTYNCYSQCSASTPSNASCPVSVVSVSGTTARGGSARAAAVGEVGTVTWTASNSPTSCSIYLNGGFVTSVGGGVTSYTTPGLPEGTTSYRVDCANVGGTGTGNTITFTVPTSPWGMSASCTGAGTTANFSWTLPGGITRTYFRYYNSPPGPAYVDYTTACNPAKTPPAGSCTDNVSGSSISMATTPGTAYYWYIHSEDAYGGWSNAVGSGPFTCVPPQPAISAAASPIGYNTATNLTWSSSGATACSITNIGAVGTGGVVSTGNLLATRTFTITCTNAGGTSVSNAVTVTVNPQNGQCNNAANNACAIGTLNDIGDSILQYLWQCVGYNGGTTDPCALDKPLPVPPTIGGTTSPIINISYPYTFKAATPDPLGNTIAYQIDWDNDLNVTADQVTGYAASNWQFTQNNSWSGAGQKYFKAKTLASDGRTSAWSATYGPLVPTPVNGACDNATQNGCLNGTTPDDAAVADTGTQWLWKCTGLNGGTSDATCNKFKPVNGVCDTAHNNCLTAGGSSSPAGTLWTWTWYCNGTYGGSLSPQCSETKPPPAAPTITGTTTGAINTAYNFNFQAADPLGLTVRYLMDWDNNGVADATSTFSTSNWTLVYPNQWAGSGVKYFKAYTEASDGRTSGWTPFNGGSGINIIPAPTVSLTPATTTVAYGAAQTIVWSSSNASTCNVTKGGAGWQSGLSNAGVTSGSLTADTQFVLTCSGVGGSNSINIWVYVKPFVSLSVGSGNIGYNASTTVTWSSTYAASCTLKNNGVLFSSALSGSSVSTGLLTANASYVLLCTAASGATDTLTVPITVAVVNGSCLATHYTCGANNTSVTNVSGPLQWTWTCNGANGGTNITTCAEVKPAPNPPTLGGPTQGQATTTYTFTFQATNPSGDDIRYAVDWTNAGTTTGNQYTATTTSGTQLSLINSWGGGGRKWFKVRTEVVGGPVSAWVTYPGIDIFGPPIVTFTGDQTIPYESPASYSFSATDADSCSFYDTTLASANPSNEITLGAPYASGPHATSSTWTLVGMYEQTFKREVICSNPYYGGVSKTMTVTVRQNGASCVAFYPPSFIVPGATTSVTIPMFNAGTNIWLDDILGLASSTRLRSQSPAENNVWGQTRVLLPNSSSVVGGVQGNFTRVFTAPATPGDYPFAWQVVQEGVNGGYTFGPTCPASTNIRGTPKSTIRVKAPLLVAGGTTVAGPAAYDLVSATSSDPAVSVTFFPIVAGDSPLPSYLHLRNLGGGTITGINVTMDDTTYFTYGTTSNLQLGPGGEMDVPINFAANATGTFGTIARVSAVGQTTIPVNVGGSATDKIIVSNNPVGLVTIDPIDFGSTATARSQYLYFTIQNKSSSQSAGVNLNAIMGGSSAFSCSATTGTTCSLNLPPLSSQTVRVKFSPTAIGPVSGTLTLHTIPLDTVIHLTGTGVKPEFTTKEK